MNTLSRKETPTTVVAQERTELSTIRTVISVVRTTSDQGFPAALLTRLVYRHA